MRLAVCFVLTPILFAQATGTVVGTVVNSITKQPIAGVSVTIRNSQNPDLSYHAVSDERGEFRIQEMQEGEYRGRCEECKKDGYHSSPAGPQLPAPPLVVTHLAPLRVRFELIPLGKLRGRVLDGEGRPVRDSSIVMAALAGGSSTGNARTDGEGRFVMEDVYPGAFTLQVNPSKNLPPPASVQGEERTAWVITYFPSATRRSEAQHIIVRAGAVLDGFEIRLRHAPVHRLRGMVLDENGKPVPGAAVRLIVPDYWSGNYGVEDRVRSGDDGAFEFPRVTERDWRLAAEIQRGQTTLKGWTSVVVQRLDVEGLVIRLAAPFAMGVEIGWTDAPADGPQRATVALRPDGDTAAENIYGIQRDRGAVALENIYPGTYHIDAYGWKADGYHLASVWFGGQEVVERRVNLANAAAPLRLVFEQGNGSIRGSIENCGSAEIALWAVDTSSEHGFLHIAACDSAGHFAFPDLAPGEYYAVAFSEIVDRYELESPEFARLMAAQGVHVRLEKGAAASIELKPIAWPE